jgi:predicted nucleic acid-binding Zn ribbon protein
MTDKPRAKCPRCGQPAARLISGGAGLVFRGSGFYITDYGKDGKGPRKSPDASAEAAPKADTAPEAKPAEAKKTEEAKPEKKPKKGSS